MAVSSYKFPEKKYCKCGCGREILLIESTCRRVFFSRNCKNKIWYVKHKKFLVFARTALRLYQYEKAMKEREREIGRAP